MTNSSHLIIKPSKTHPAIILIFVLLGFAQTLNAQTNSGTHQRIENISFSEGLPNAFVNDIAQDAMGFIWVATNAGLYRYDGYSFMALRSDPRTPGALTGNYISKIEATPDGLIWIATIGKGLFCYDIRNEEFKDLKLPAEAQNLNLNHFVIENDSSIWLATERGLALLTLEDEKSSIEFYHLSREELQAQTNQSRSSQHEYINYLHLAENNNQNFLWIGINEGLYTFTISTEKFESVNTHYRSSFRTIQKLNNEHYLAGFWYGGFLVYDTNKQVVESHPALQILKKLPEDIQINRLYHDDKKLLISTENHGLFLLNISGADAEIQEFSVESTHGVIRSNAVSMAMRDNTGLLWIAHEQGGGISKVIDSESEILGLVNHGLDKNRINIRDLDVLNNRYLIAATMGDGILIHDLTTGKTLTGTDKPDADFKTHTDDYHSVLLDSRGNLWLGTKGKGVEFIHHKKLTEIINQSTIQHPASILIKNENYPGWINNYIMSLHEDSRGRVWVGSWRGLYMFPSAFVQKTEKSFPQITIGVDDIVTFVQHTDLRESVILSIEDQSDGSILVGTRHRGLLRLATGPELRVITPKQLSFPNLPDIESVYALRSYNDTLYIAANTGIAKINPGLDSVLNYLPIERFDYMEPVGIYKKNNRIIVSGSYGIKVLDNNFSGMQTFLFPESERFNQYNYNSFVSVADTAFVGSYSGISRIFFPEAPTHQKSFPLRIARFSIDNQTIYPGQKSGGRTILRDNINLTRGVTMRSGSENILSIDLAITEFSAPHMNQFKYRLEGVHEDFLLLSPGQRNITFANLKPSNYELLIRGFDKNGLPAQNEIKLNLRILPPWYQSRLAYFVYLSIIAAVFYSISRFYVLRDRQKNELHLERAERKKSEELHQYKMQFFTNISHEIRTPMALIMAPLEQLLQKEHTREDKENLKLISENASRLLFLVEQILNIRKIDNNKLEIKKKRTDIVLFSRQIFDMYKKYAEQKNVTYIFHSSHPHLPFGFDSFVLETILFNLVSNAFKYVHEGGRITLSLQFEDNQQLSISVKDNGIGISPEAQSQVFDRFFTISPESGKGMSGTKGNGIGLSLSRDMVELHGGKIKVESEPGKGSIFTVELQEDPQVEQPTEPAEYNTAIDPLKASMIEIELNTLHNQQKLSISEALKDDDGNLFNILLIDDNLELLKFLQASLQQHYNITAVPNAEEALKVLDESLPDLIVSDIMMPGMNGLELVRIIKGSSKMHHIPIVLLSARAREKQSQEGYLAGADAYISKPFSMNFLITRINQILNARSKMRDFYKQTVLMSPSNIDIEPEEKQFMEKMIEIIEENIDDEQFGVDAFAKALNMSRAKLYRKVAKLTDKSVKEIIRDMRLQRAEQLLKTNVFSVNEVGYKVGFVNTSYFIKCFREKYGKTPKELMEEILATQKKETFMEGSN